jgi:4-amino-4-deoxy-L-arabinose transferase-like glycosyltransferase
MTPAPVGDDARAALADAPGERRRRLRRAALVTLFAALLVLPPLGSRQIVTGDEARFAVLAQDMLKRDTWLDARVRNQRYRNKPLLYPWAIKVLSLPRGRVTETTAQLPIAVAALIAVFFVTILGQQLYSPRAGVWAGLITATSYGFFAHSQILLPDMLVVACGVAALSAFWASVGGPAGSAALILFYLAVALGVFAKGPMGLLPLLVVAVWLITEHGVRGLRRLVSPVGAVAFAVISAAWLVPFLLAGSRTFARNVLWEDWLAWFLGTPDPGRLVNVLLNAAQGLVPWTTLLVLPLLAVRAEWTNGAMRFAFLAWLVPLVVVAVSANHRARYLLPTYPAAALLMAWWADRPHREHRPRIVAVVVLSALGVLAALVVLALPWLDPHERGLVAGFWWKAALVSAGAVGMAGYACWTLWRERRAWLVNGLVAGTAVLFALGLTIYNDGVNRGQDYRAFAGLIDRHARGGEIGVHGGRFFSIDFYLERALTPVRTAEALTAWLGRPGRPLVVMSGRALKEVEARLPATEVVDTMRVRSHVMYVVRRAEP